MNIPAYIVCPHCGERYPYTDGAHVCSTGPRAPQFPPATKPWVGLTDEDVTSSHSYSITRDKGCFHAGAKWAEAKLREKNT